MKPAMAPIIDRGPTRPTRPWSAILDHFRDVVGQHAMFALVDHIAAAPYAERLYGYTSMHTLLIAQTREVYPTQEVVRVAYSDGRFLVTCQERGFVLDVQSGDAVSRSVPETEGVAALERLLRAKRWD